MNNYDDDEDLLKKVEHTIDIIELGAQANDFLSTTIGKYLIGRAKQQRASALEELLQIDPSDYQKIRSSQNKALVADLIIQWIDSIIVEGINADKSLEEFYNNIN